MSTSVLLLPGFKNSGPQHWQSLWEQSHVDFKRVQQKDWNYPVCEEWICAVENAIKEAGPDVVLVAHSLACLVVAQWASKPHLPIKAALLVGMPDVQSKNFPKEATGFFQPPLLPFDFPSIVVASTNDQYATISYASSLAKAWGSRFVNIGAYGHINADSGLGNWEEGYKLLVELQK